MKKLKSLKSTKFEKLEGNKIENLYAAKGGYDTPAGFREEVGLEYHGDCNRADGGVDYDYKMW
jgi:hypothetical protein